MVKDLFKGTCTALVTPFINGKINYRVLDALIQRQRNCGIRCLAIGCTTGEGATLKDDEKIELLVHSRRFAGDDIMLLAGTGSNATTHAVELSVAAQENGADGLLIVTPYYNKATDAGLIAHYRTIAEAVSIPIIVYNVPSRTGVDIPINVYHELSQIPNIVGVKEATTDIRKLQKIRSNCKEDFGIWIGNDDMAVAGMAVGADGLISVASNVVPASVHAMIEAARSGNCASAFRIQRHILPLIEMLFCEINPIPVKKAMSLIGLDCGNCRLPLTDLSEQYIADLGSCINSAIAYESSVL